MEQITLLFSALGLVITALTLFFSLRSFRQQLRLNFFADYTKRYQEIILHFPENINESNFTLETLPSEVVKNKTLRYMRAYFDLCSEEYFLWKEGHIDQKTWKEWEEGICFAFSKPAFKEAWDKLRLDTFYYGDFKDFVKSAIGTTQV